MTYRKIDPHEALDRILKGLPVLGTSPLSSERVTVNHEKSIGVLASCTLFTNEPRTVEFEAEPLGDSGNLFCREEFGVLELHQLSGAKRVRVVVTEILEET
jgi:hypothetical protein